MLDHKVAPGPQTVQGAEVDRLLLADHRVCLVVDHRPNQARLVVEVVVELGARDVRCRSHVVDRRVGDALLKDQIGGRVNDALARLLTLACQSARGDAGSAHGADSTSDWIVYSSLLEWNA